MTFKTIFNDINKVAVARDSLSGIRFDSKNVAVVEAYKNAIKGLNEEQARYVLSKRYVSEADQADLLTKAEIIAANDGVKASELSRQLVLQGVRKEQAEALIEQISGNEAITSNTVLTKEQTMAILEQAEARKILSAQQRKNIADDIEETASSAQEASAEMVQASADVAESGAKMGSASSILARSVTQLGVGFKSLLSIFVSSPVAIIATLTGSVIGLTYVIGKFQDTAKNAAKAASEFSSSMSSANSTYNQESDSLNDLTEKYEDLREQLINAKGDEEKTYDIKSQLLELQEQLNEIYGDECDKVNLVTDAYKDQTAELKKNAKQKADNYLNTHVDEINEATKKMTADYEYELGNFNYGLQDASVGNELHEQIKKLAEKSGIEWDDNKGFVFKGTAEEASKAIDQFMTNVRELRDSEDGLSDGIINNLKAFDSSMSDQLGVANEIIDGYQETYETAQMAQIASDKNLSQGYNEAVSAVEAYNDAVSKSDNPYDDENVKKAWDNLQTVKSGIQGNEDEWGQYSNIMDKVFSSASDDVYSFYQAIQNDDSIKSLTNDLQGLTDVDLQSMANDDTEDSFDKLCEAAKKYGLEVQDVIDLLIQLGIVQGKVQEQNSEETPILSTDELKEKLSDLNSAIDEIQSAYDTLTSACEEYNENGGKLSIDTIQSLMGLSSEYLACLQDENGQLSINADAMAVLANAKLDEAQALAIEQAMTELNTIATGNHTKATADYVTGNAALLTSLQTLSGKYDEVASSAMTAAQAQALSAGIDAASAVDPEATKKTMDALNEKLKLISATRTQISTGNLGSLKKSGSSSKGSSSSSDPIKEQFETEYNLLKHNLEMEYITEKDYYDGVQALNDKYFKGKEKYLDEYQKYEEEVYKGLKSYYKDYVDKKMDYYEKALDANRITFNMYSSAVKTMLDDMWKSGKLSAEDYWSYVEKMLNKQKDIMDRVLSAVTNRIQEEADKWQKKIDELNAVNDKLNEQKDKYDGILSAVNEVYDKEISRLNEKKDALQDEIDAINDESDAIDLQKRKEQSLYDLENAQRNRTKKIYTDGEGYSYVQDSDAVKDAKDNLNDIEKEEKIKKLQQEQEDIQKNIDLLKEYQDLWSEIPDLWQKKANEQLAIELWGQDYEQRILQNRSTDIEDFRKKYLDNQEQINNNEQLINSYQEKVDYYSNLKSEWEAISSEYEEQIGRQYAAQILGQGWEADVLSGRLDTLDTFKKQYVEIQKSLVEVAWNAANEQIRALNAVKDAEATKAKTSGGTAKDITNGTGSGNDNSGNSGNSGSALSSGITYVVKLEAGAVLYSTKKQADASNYIRNNNLTIIETKNTKTECIYRVRKKQQYKIVNFRENNKTIKDGFATFKEAQDYINAHPGLKSYARVDHYAKGTNNAKPGLHFVSDGTDDEIVINNDDTAVIPHGKQLYNFQGGETVIPGDETKKILENQGNVTRLPDGRELLEDGSVKFPDGTMLTPVANPLENLAQPDLAKAMESIQLPHYQQRPMDYGNVTKNETIDQSVSIGDIHVYEVNDADHFAKAILSEVPIKIQQQMFRKK